MKQDIERANQQLLAALKRDTEIRQELEKRNKIFKGYDPDMRKCHEDNADLLEEYISQYGWPFPTKFGEKLHEAAWIIAIHAISRPQLLRKTLDIMAEALAKGEGVASAYARLVDRIALYEGRQQIYGTQFFPSPMGFYAKDLKDPENVDKRRAEIGLATFLEGKEECGAGEGGVITAAEMGQHEKDYIKFLKEVG